VAGSAPLCAATLSVSSARVPVAASWLSCRAAVRHRLGGRRGQNLRVFLTVPSCSWALRAASRRLTSLVAANKSTSPSAMDPSSSAVDMGSTKVKLLADGDPVTVAGPTAAVAGPGAAVACAGVTGSTLATPAGLISGVPTPEGVASAVPVAGVVAAAGGAVAGEADGEGVLAGDRLAGGVVAAAVGALTVTVSSAAGSTVIAGLVAASAVAVRVTEVTDVVPEATAICACIWYDDGVTAVASAPIVQVADPSPLGQRPVNEGSSPCGVPVSVTDTPDAEPFAAQTCTVYDAAWPLVMLDWEVWTLTHNSAWVEAVGDGVAAEGSGSHCELVAATAAPPARLQAT
jgi:hypothetical protein